MPDSIWKSSLERFREQVAQGPVPASASVSAVSSSLALSLVAMVLKASVKRKDFAGDILRADALVDAAQSESARMMRYADDDIAGFGEYLGTLRLPKLTAEDRAKRQLAVEGALRKATEMPLDAARAAARGIDLCFEVASVAHPVVAADLGGAAALLAGAVRALLLAVDSNLSRVKPDSEFYREMGAERRQLEDRAMKQAAAVLDRLAAVLTEHASKRQPV